MKTRLLTIGIIFIGAVFFIFTNKPNSKNTVPASTIPTHEQVLAVATGIPGSCHAIQENSSDLKSFEPDRACTPGAVNPSVTQDNIFSTICRSGYTKTIRPPVSYTEPLKTQSITAYGYPDTYVKDYEEDHLISLELGGSPTDPKNLWAEPGASPNEKDAVENYLHKQVCNGSITLAQAQKEISTDWYQVYMNLRK